MRFYDAHFHLSDWTKSSRSAPPQDVVFCTSASSAVEFSFNEEYARAHPGQAFLSFGLHPQLPAMFAEAEAEMKKEGYGVVYGTARMIRSGLDFLEALALEGRICACGEIGFDFFSEAYRRTEAVQRDLWDAQIAIAAEYALPAVLHVRKALALVFGETRRLKALPAVVFHGWGGTPDEARAILRRGVNAYFSFGKVLLRGSGKAAACVRSLPADRLLFETDAPYMTLKGEAFSSPGDIGRVLAFAAPLRGLSAEELAALSGENFRAVFGGRERPGCRKSIKIYQ